MWNSTQHYRREFTGWPLGRDGLGVTHLEHRLLIDCIRRADPEDAERVLVMHIRRTRSELGRHPEIFAERRAGLDIDRGCRQSLQTDT